MAKKAVLHFLNSPKLISRKILVTKNSNISTLCHEFLIISDYESYDQLRKITCKELGLTYRPDPIIEPHTVREVFLPEDKLKAGMKERIVASLVNEHEICEEQVGLRLKFEDKIKRPYFHVRPLDLKQLKNWDAYLDFEIGKISLVIFHLCIQLHKKFELAHEKKLNRGIFGSRN